MGLRRKRSMLEKFRDDVIFNIEQDGSDVTFEWTELTGATWNDVYEVYKGGTPVAKSYTERCIGKIIDYKEDYMEAEFARFNVGECILRFAYDSPLFSTLEGKGDVTFAYQGQRFKIDSPLFTGDMYNNAFYSCIVRGVKEYKGGVPHDTNEN